MTKLYWHSTTPWGPSSYSVLTKRTVPPIVRMGYEVIVGTWYGLQGAPQQWPVHMDGKNGQAPVKPVTILPSVDPQSYGIDTLLANYEMVGAEALITCMDVWVVPPDLTSRTKFCPWVPIDHDPVPDQILNSLRPSLYTMVYSKWGVEVLKKAGVESHYVPCSAPADVFKPGDKELAKKKLGVPGKFMVSMVAANKDPGDRKGFGEAIQAYAAFAAAHDDVCLYIHTNWNGPVNISHLLQRLELTPAKVAQPNPLYYVNGMYGDDYMRDVFVASDLLLNPAKSEGFGLPLLEAQMCGTPIACTDFSTTDELLFAGWKIEGQRHWSIGADSWRVLANVANIVDVLEDCYHQSDKARKKLAIQARNGAIALDTETVAKQFWAPALKEIDEIVSHKGGELKLVEF